ncbi:MAG: hypothetical protein FJ137_11130 [Deltaproteobacteria bacterium]|nr:hypothetical protein [Deltaproteobacteria bacterium]
MPVRPLRAASAAARGPRAALATVVAGLAVACATPPEPHYDDDIGIAAEPIAPGAAAGTFALKVVNTTLVHIPVLGDAAGGGTNYRLVRRTWDADASRYRQTSQLCGGYNVEVGGVTTTLPEATYRAVPASAAEQVTIDDDGTYAQTDHLQLWGLRDLPDPFSTPLPANAEEAQQAPHADRVVDMDADGNPGVTAQISGAVQGDVYIVQRKTVTTRGVVLGPDRALGLAQNTNELVQVGNTNPLLSRQSEGGSEPHPDPRRSWFEEVRVADEADCDLVMSAEDDGLLSVIPPFPDDGDA